MRWSIGQKDSGGFRIEEASLLAGVYSKYYEAGNGDTGVLHRPTGRFYHSRGQ